MMQRAVKKTFFIESESALNLKCGGGVVVKNCKNGKGR